MLCASFGKGIIRHKEWLVLVEKRDNTAGGGVGYSYLGRDGGEVSLGYVCKNHLSVLRDSV